MKDWLINLSMVKFVWLAAFVIVGFRIVDHYLNGGHLVFGGEFQLAFLVTLKAVWDKRRAERGELRQKHVDNET